MNTEADTPLTAVEGIKARSNFLRGSIVSSLADSATGALAEDDTQLSKFHGFYQQDDRDIRDDRRRQMLEPDYQFMIRSRVPGGICSTTQWLALDEIAQKWANGTIRITTRQAFQLHGVIKKNLKPTIASINDSLMDTIAACGDVNRNVMSSPLPERSELHRQVTEAALAVSAHLTPNTTAYHEIWLRDGDQRVNVAQTPKNESENDQPTDNEPIYGPTYLPRKFKMAFAIPPRNDTDVLAHDLGFIAIEEAGELAGFNVTVAGGMGASHGDPATFPRIADVFGFCTVDQVVAISEAIVTIQRDYGDRTDRKHARFKYTIEDRGLDWFHDELEKRLGYRLPAPRSFEFTHTGDEYGWQKTDDGLWHLVLHIENGRVADRGVVRQLTGLREIAKIHGGEFRLSPNQNLIISGVENSQRTTIDRLVTMYRLDSYRRASKLRLNAMACVGFPTCALSMAESERYLPELVGKIDTLMLKHDLADQAITIRMTGCPNGCARPYLAEIGLVGKGPGLYNLHLGAAFNGLRLNRLYRESIHEEDILQLLDGLFEDYVSNRSADEAFGDFLVRSGLLDQKTNPIEERATS